MNMKKDFSKYSVAGVPHPHVGAHVAHRHWGTGAETVNVHHDVGKPKPDAHQPKPKATHKPKHHAAHHSSHHAGHHAAHHTTHHTAHHSAGHHHGGNHTNHHTTHHVSHPAASHASVSHTHTHHTAKPKTPDVHPPSGTMNGSGQRMLGN